MKKLLACLIVLLATMSCNKDENISLPSDSTTSRAVTFTASVEDVSQTKATLKNSWSGGEEIMLFVDGDDTFYRLTIAEDGSLSGSSEIIVGTKESVTYTAFYPADIALETIREYELKCLGCETDYLKAEITTQDTEVNLQFKHQSALISVSFIVEGEATDYSISMASDVDYDKLESLEVDATINTFASKLCATYLVAGGTDISSVLVEFENNGLVTYHFIKEDDITTLEAGNYYTFSYTIGDLSTGEGTEASPHIIYTADDMRKVGSGDGWNLDSYYILAWDIDLASTEFTSIGSDTAPFTGSFDGVNRAISGLNINQPTSDYQGLFGYTSGATISNLGVSGTVIGNGYVGTIVGCLSGSSTVSSCYSTCTVSGLGERVGGVVGSANSSTITDCYNTAATSGTSYVGGVVGSVDNSTMTDCYNRGKISGTSYIGGLAGDIINASSASYSYNVGLVSGESYIGGVAGYADVAAGTTTTLSYLFYDYSVVVGVGGAINGSSSGTKYNSLTTANMKGAATTTGTLLSYFTLEGSTNWVADSENINDGYPVLMINADND